MIKKTMVVLTVIFYCQQHMAQSNNNEIITMKSGKKVVGDFQLVFADEFNGTTLNQNIWKPANGVFRDPEHKVEKQWYTPANIEISNGTLKLWAKRDTLKNQNFSIWIKDGMKPFTSDFEFTSAEIETHKQYQYGMYEIRCKIPKGKGLWPAFWMYGESNGVNNEIDVFEFWNQRSTFSSFSKNKLARVHNMTAHYKGRMSGTNYKGDDFSEDFHIFTVVWDECKLEWYVDGELKRTITRFKKSGSKKYSCDEQISKFEGTKENVLPRDQAMTIIANLALQANDAKPFEEDPFPVAFEIDYIRFYERIEKTTAPEK